MRLINTTTLTMREFHGNDVPEYIILSHRWTDDEISYEDFANHDNADSTGYRKVIKCCHLASQRDVEWVWVDTCCIDKRSSAELSEAINSMYRWYAGAVECWAFLADVHDSGQGYADNFIDERVLAQFRTSDWFNRGWTLQELIAPRTVRFLSSSWRNFGIKGYGPGFHLEEHIRQITGISTIVLEGRTSPQATAVAQRMSWASSRTTTREEDIAYCLLGLLGVNMPLLYGEGQRAWYRLQKAIIQSSHDESVFAWSCDTQPHKYTTPILAPTPYSFRYCGDIHQIRLSTRLPYSITNQGLELHLRTTTARQFRVKGARTIIILPLACAWRSTHWEESPKCTVRTIGLLQRWCGHFERFSMRWNTVCLPRLCNELRNDLDEVVPIDDAIYVHAMSDESSFCGAPTSEFEAEPVVEFFALIRRYQDRAARCACHGQYDLAMNVNWMPVAPTQRSLKRTQAQARKEEE